MKQLLPELDRIYAGRTSSEITGHPVHYMVQTDDGDICEKSVELLLQSLYANGRLQNRRYSTIAFELGCEIPRQTYDQLYKSNSGGAVIVLYRAGCDDADDLADGSRDTIDCLCNAMKKYRNQVLTVFCLRRECSSTKEFFFENLGTTSFIELQEEFAQGKCAKDYLKMLARENHIRTDKKLLERVEEEKSYLAPDLQCIFDEWYNRKLKTVIYPQYKETATVKREIAKAKPKGTAYDELMEMVGLNEAKKVILQALNYRKAQKLFADKGMKTDYPSMHMVFTGNPIHVTVFEALYPLVTLFFFSLGVGLFLAAATVFFRDIMHIWSVFITALLYFSAIFYDPTQMTFSIGGFNMQQIIKLNPMYWYITGFRRTLMWGIPLDINMFLVCGLCALISMQVGVQMFRKTQDRFVLHI